MRSRLGSIAVGLPRLLAVGCLSGAVVGQSPQGDEVETLPFRLSLDYEIEFSADAVGAVLHVVIPSSFPGQVIESVEIEADHEIRTVESGQVASFALSAEGVKPSIVVEGVLSPADWALENGVQLPPGFFDTNLAEEKFLESGDLRVQRLAEDARGSTVEAAAALCQKVIETLDYVQTGRIQGASGVLTSKRGACGEYSDLLVALCRAKGIPARTCDGFSVARKEQIAARHTWVQVWDKLRRRWVTIDPSFGELYGDAFGLPPLSLILCKHHRNDDLLVGGSTFTWWTDAGSLTVREVVGLELESR